jgi:hypothetical protein
VQTGLQQFVEQDAQPAFHDAKLEDAVAATLIEEIHLSLDISPSFHQNECGKLWILIANFGAPFLNETVAVHFESAIGPHDLRAIRHPRMLTRWQGNLPC